MTVLVLLGAPGAGKGTQAPILAERLGIPVLASGNLLRAAVADGTALGREADRFMSRGQLVPDATIVRVVLMPAVMELLGDRNWYLPRWLEWLPNVHVEGEAERC